MNRVKKGTLAPNGVSLEKHEYDTVLFLTSLGYNIKLIKPSHIPNVRTPDFRMQRLDWEMKSPKGRSRSTLEHAFKNAVKQSENIIFDIRRTGMPEDKALVMLTNLMKSSKSAKRLGVITKRHQLLWFGVDFGA